MGIMSTNVTSPGYPSTYSTLESIFGKPFRTLPEGVDGPLDAQSTSFLRRIAPALVWGRPLRRTATAALRWRLR